MLESYITLYCITYDPYRCRVDPERVWSLVQSAGGSCHAGAAGSLDFYVPEEVASLVMLMDAGLRIAHKKSYI